MEDLIRYSNEVSRKKDANAIRSNILSVIELKYKIDQESRRKLQKDSEELANRQKLKDEEEKTKNAKISALKELLMDDKDQTELKNNDEENKEVEYRLEIIAMNKNNEAKLKEILEKQKQKQDALKNNDNETLYEYDEFDYEEKYDDNNEDKHSRSFTYFNENDFLDIDYLFQQYFFS